MTVDLSYPVGRFTAPMTVTPELRAAAIDEIAALPQRLREAIASLSDTQLDTRYRPGGWTVRQVVHHLADSHLNAYVRLKLALTEDAPTVKPYDEKTWADLVDTRMPVTPSLAILDGVHARWVAVLRALQPDDYARTFRHPEYPDKILNVDWLGQQYAWHCRHHVAHIRTLRQRQGW
jgi:hypothetical protein